jgi:uncharacterized membrane protein YeaQ/YmgE (transglycosylase-associated protein family)
MDTTDPNLRGAIEDFKKGGWVVSLFGGAGMLARMLLTDQSSRLIIWIRRTLAGSIVGVLAYFAVWGQPIDGIYKAIILSVSGAVSPELLEYFITRVKGETLNVKNKAKKSKRKRK